MSCCLGGVAVEAASYPVARVEPCGVTVGNTVQAETNSLKNATTWKLSRWNHRGRPALWDRRTIRARPLFSSRSRRLRSLSAAFSSRLVSAAAPATPLAADTKDSSSHALSCTRYPTSNIRGHRRRREETSRNDEHSRHNHCITTRTTCERVSSRYGLLS